MIATPPHSLVKSLEELVRDGRLREGALERLFFQILQVYVLRDELIYSIKQTNLVNFNLLQQLADSELCSLDHTTTQK